jgi:hypothetical protein
MTERGADAGEARSRTPSWLSAIHHGVSAILVAVGLCYLLRLESAARLCAVSVTVITLVPRLEAAHLVAFHRFLEVSYGVTCALAYTVASGVLRARWRRVTSDGPG